MFLWRNKQIQWIYVPCLLNFSAIWTINKENVHLKIISKPHAYLQTMTKTPVKFKKDWNKTAGGVAHTRYPLSIHFNSIEDWKITVFKMRKKGQKLIWGLYPKHMHIFRPWQKTPAKFQKDRHKAVGEVVHKRYPLSRHFDSIEDWKITVFKMRKKGPKINLRIISKTHAHLQTMTKNTPKVSKRSA